MPEPTRERAPQPAPRCAARFFILSGGPCSGKTTVARALAARGHLVVPEAATELIEDPKTRRLRSAPLEFQRAVLARQLENEARALGQLERLEPRGQRGDGRGTPSGGSSSPAAAGGSPAVFLDRGVGDGFGYLRHYGLDFFAEILAAWDAAAGRYRAVFFLEQKPDYHSASHRDEPAEVARQIHRTILEEYRARHPCVVCVPWIPVDERVSWVLKEAERFR
jgi:predicted ATPase